MKRWSEDRWKDLTREPLLRDTEDTLRRLVRGNFHDLSPGEREEKADQVIRFSARAAMAMAAAPVPFLELPVQLAMVRAIAKIHGVERPGRKVLMELAGALGGSLFLRQVLRMLPVVGPLPHISRIYGATWALGQAACLYFGREGAGGDRAGNEDLRRVFEETAAKRSREQSGRMERGDLEDQLRYLDDLRAREVINEEEYRRKRAELLELK